ncbi:MFS general substrate transporter [Parathielavia appendiculata]|uniref:MFS general substrate transporter n=1 Tax=Parathielavia appendiculata TaxID=2587402 RepID=A0AAN6Z4C7_9PEZI|nr:MFS general substrate transporter [Parathielavia appendiculata]
MSSTSDIRHQLWVLGLIRATEAIAWTSTFPYAYFMIRSFEVPEHDIAFYAGALVAVFTFGEFLTGVVWARVSDRIGRKPTALVGIFCGFVTAFTLGLSRSVAVVIASRAFGGLFNPNVGLVVMLFVIAKAFSLFLGGLLADPAALYPSIFPPNSAWTSYPYLLPNLAVSLLQVLTFILALLVLQETHPRMRDIIKHGTYAPLAEDAAGLEAEVSATEEHPLEDFQREEEQRDGAQKRAFTFQVILQILAVSLLAFHKVASDSLMGTFLALDSGGNGGDNKSTADGAATRANISFPHSSVGFGFDTRTIGIIFLTEANSRAAIQPTAIPWFISKLGALRAFRWVLGLYPATYIVTPFIPKIPSPFHFVLLLLDLWIKAAFSSVGYICSAVL